MLKDIQVYVSRDDISTDEEKTMYNVVFKTGYWRFYWGSWNGFQNASGRNLGSCLWIDGFGKALKPLPVVKTDADGKPT
jgi:lysyl-tRNA synthetase class 2